MLRTRMTVGPASPLFAASHDQSMAEKAEGKMAFVLTGLSCLLVAKMVWDQFSFADRERLREVDRRYPTLGDRRR